MKRFLVVVFALMICISPIVPYDNVSAISASLILKFDTVTVNPGATFDYDVLVDTNSKGFTLVNVCNILTQFKSQGFEITGAKAGSLISSSQFEAAVDYDRYYIKNASVNSTGKLFTITVKAPSKSGTYEFKPEIAEAYNGSTSILATYSTGKVVVSETAGGNTENEQSNPKNTWISNGGKWYYYDANGNVVKDWQRINGVWYYFNNSGVMATGWTLVNSTYFYMDKNGKMLTGWQLIDGKYYYFNSNGYMYKGWLLDNNKWYYLNGSGAMQVGWVKDGNTYYYMSKSGQMMSNYWLKEGNYWYYLTSSGSMATGWKLISGSWYFFEKTNGNMISGRTIYTDGKYYTFNSQGVCVNP